MSAGLLERAALIALMAFFSLFMWCGWPLGLIYLVSKLVQTTAPTFGPYLIIIIGVPLGMVAVGKLLGWLDRHYRSRTADEGDRYRPGWLKSMRDDRAASHHWHVLDVVMLWSVAVAGTAMGIWFVFFAGSSI